MRRVAILIMMFSAMAWAQDSTQATPPKQSTPQDTTKPASAAKKPATTAKKTTSSAAQKSGATTAGAKKATLPTHSQIAKDDPDHPLHGAADRLAHIADREIGRQMIKVWESKGQPMV